MRRQSRGLRIKKYYEAVMQIVSKHPEFHDMRIVAHAKILNAEAILLLHELAKNSLITMGRKIDVYRDLLISDWAKFDAKLLVQLQELYSYALKHQNFLALSNLVMDKIGWEFAKVFHFHAISNWNREQLAIDPEVSQDDRELLLNLLTRIDTIVDAYNKLQHRENQFLCLRSKYQILGFLGNRKEADECAKEMKMLIDTYEMNALRTQFEQMLQGDMKHRKLMVDLAERKQLSIVWQKIVAFMSIYIMTLPQK